jgi:hypothetical protein
MVTENSNGKMALNTEETFVRTTSKAQEGTDGAMEENSLENGTKTK